jgi:hypothetical protein
MAPVPAKTTLRAAAGRLVIRNPSSGQYDSQSEKFRAAELPDMDARSIPFLSILDVLSNQVSIFHSRNLRIRKPYT